MTAGRHAAVAPGADGRTRRFGRAARYAIPLVALAVIAIVVAGLLGSFGAFVAGIQNSQNHVRSATTLPPTTVILNENDQCSAPADGVAHECTPDLVNKFGGGTLTSNDRRSVSITLRNDGNVAANLFLLPSNCSDTLTGARGALCNQVNITVNCSIKTPPPVVGPVTLNQFHDQRAYPTGYLVGTLAPGASTSCVFTLTTGVISQAGTVTQPMAIRLTGV